MKRLFYLILTLSLPFFLNAQTLKDVKKRGEIDIAFTESWKNTVNYTAAQEFAKFLDIEFNNVTITWDDVFAHNGKIPEDYKTNPDISYTPDALKRADIICGTIYVLDWRKKFFDYSGIIQISDLLITKKNISKKVKSNKDLAGLKIAFLENSTYETNISLINEKIGGGIEFVKTKSEDESLRLLTDNKVDGLITVSFLALSYVKNNENLKLSFPVNKPQDVGWAVRKGNSEIQKEIRNFFETIKGNGKLDELFREKYDIDYSTYLEIINSYSNLIKSAEIRDFDEIKSSGKIIIALRDRDLVYHPEGKKQFNHLLAESFADYLGLKAEFVITEKFSRYFENDEGIIIKDSAYNPKWFNEFDVACDLIDPLDWRLKKVDVLDFMPNAKVVIGRKDTKISSVNDLKNLTGVTSKGSSYEHALSLNNIDNYYYNTGNNFFSDVIQGKADYTISNISVFKLADFPELEAKFIIGEIRKMGWAIKKNQALLRQKILEFFEYARKNGIFDEYFKHQAGMTMQSAQNYLTVLHETYQEGYFPFVFYGKEKGLPQEDALSIFQDNEGYLWFGTYSGAAKYNGRSMKIYNTKSGTAGNAVMSINQDKEGKIYFAGLNGITVLDKKTETLKTYFNGIPFKGIYIDNKVKFFYGDKGIYSIDEKGKEVYLNKLIKNLPKKINSISKKPESNQFIIASGEGLYYLRDKQTEKIVDEFCLFAFYDTDSRLWISTNTGFYYTDTEITSIEEASKINDLLNIHNTPIKEIKQTKNGSLWLISDYKIYQLLTLKQKPIVYDKNTGLLNQKILSFFMDNEENFWFGFSGGIQKLTNKSLRILYPRHLNSTINSVFKDKTGRVWIGMSTGIHYIKGEISNFTDVLKLKNNSFVIGEMSNHDIIIADTKRIFIIDQKTLRVKKEKKFKNTLFHLNDIFVTKNDEIFLMTGNTGIVYYLKDIKSDPIKIENPETILLSQIVEFGDMIIGANNSGLVVFDSSSFKPLKDINYHTWTLHLDSIYDNNKNTYKKFLWVGTQNGLAEYINDTLEYVNPEVFNGISVTAIEHAENPEMLWLGTDEGVKYYNKITNSVEFIIDSRDGLLGNEISVDGLYLDKRNTLWIGTYHGIATFDIKKKKVEKYSPVCRIESITINGERFLKMPEKLKSSQNNISFEISGLSFKDENSVEYEFYLQGLDNEYASSKGKDNIAVFPYLPPGKYSFKYRTKGKDDIWSYYQSIDFEIKKPFYLEWWFIAPVILLILLTFLLVSKWRVRILQKQNEKLEETVAERTIEITEKNIELEAQKEEIEAQRDVAEEQRDEITHQKKEIEDSILYAKRIQNAILPPTKLISRLMPDNFILFKPRDIVSGDFYWAAEKNNITYYAAADSTGHGVPGAFMSMLGISFLNGIIRTSKKELKASEVLDQLKSKVIEALHQTGEAHEAKDGMDIALCKVNSKKNIVEFAGAFNPLYIVRDNEIIIYEADRMPIGIYDFDIGNDKFTNNVIQLEKGDALYTFSDGYADQFGGPKDKKFMIGRFKKLLLNIQDLPMDQQRKRLKDSLENWMENYEQIDDILVIGAKF
ncbi:MAG: transporter substrate-binding domain-containing protein [Bacteroidales bacterium]|nr:transporter substrate-binding domain-containing protein [Bacteroidales bacterium]